MKVRLQVDVNMDKEDSCIGCSSCKTEGEYHEYCGVFGHTVNWKGTKWKPTKQCYANRIKPTERN
jgi:hypothetical protein